MNFFGPIFHYYLLFLHASYLNELNTIESSSESNYFIYDTFSNSSNTFNKGITILKNTQNFINLVTELESHTINNTFIDEITIKNLKFEVIETYKQMYEDFMNVTFSVLSYEIDIIKQIYTISLSKFENLIDKYGRFFTFLYPNAYCVINEIRNKLEDNEICLIELISYINDESKDNIIEFKKSFEELTGTFIKNPNLDKKLDIEMILQQVLIIKKKYFNLLEIYIRQENRDIDFETIFANFEHVNLYGFRVLLIAVENEFIDKMKFIAEFCNKDTYDVNNIDTYIEIFGRCDLVDKEVVLNTFNERENIFRQVLSAIWYLYDNSGFIKMFL